MPGNLNSHRIIDINSLSLFPRTLRKMVVVKKIFVLSAFLCVLKKTKMRIATIDVPISTIHPAQKKCKMNCQVHSVELELCGENIGDGLRAVLHSILFLRSIGKVSHPRQGQCKYYPSLCYAKLPAFDAAVEQAVELGKQQLKTSPTAELVLSFFEKRPKSSGIYSLLGTGEEIVYFERFFITMRLVSSFPKPTPPSEEDVEYADFMRREEVALRRAILKCATFGNVKLLPYTFRGDHPLFEITGPSSHSSSSSSPRHTTTATNGGWKPGEDHKPWFGLFG